MTRALYLIGGPGVGKSTVMASLLSGWQPLDYERIYGKLRGHLLVSAGIPAGLYLGRLREGFPGTDGLSMSAHPDAVAWAESLTAPAPVSLILGEGARLGTAGFLTALHRTTDLTVVHLVASPAVSLSRRDGRRSGQNSSWVKGATTRAAVAAQRCREAGCRVLSVDADRPVAEVVEEIETAA